MRKNRSTSLLLTVAMALVLTLIIFIFGTRLGSADDWDINQLMRSLAQNQGSRATFVEKKILAVLDVPVESSGELLYRSPGYFEKITLRPKPESLILDRDVLTIVRGARTNILPLQNYPEIGAVVGSIIGTLAGDRALLEQAYRLNLEGNEARWILTLVPLEREFIPVVQKIRMYGAGGVVKVVEMLQADGDRSVMSIEIVKTP